MSHAHEIDTTEGETSGGRNTRKLALVAGFNFVGFVAELAGGLLFGSVALVSDALHMLFDMLAYAMAFGASYTAERFEGGETWSYGLHRLEPVAAFLNGALLVPMVGYIVWEAYRRFLDPVTIDPGVTLAIAVGGLLVNLGSVSILRGDELSLNERGAFYHLLGDAGGSIAVIVSTIAVAAFDLPVADPVAAIFIAALILWSAGRVLRESAGILLQRSPVSSANLRSDLANADGVDRVADIHVWQVCSQLTVGTVRVVTPATASEERRRIRTSLHETLAIHGVDHRTVELLDAADPEPDRSPHSH